MVRVAIVGHSQIPYINSYDDVEISTFKLKGALCSDFFDYPLNECLQQEYDVVIIFLGGNDIGTSQPAEIVDALLNIVRELSNVNQVYLTQIEHRTYPLGHKYYVEENTYRKKAKAVNRKLVKKAPSEGYRTLNISSQDYNDNSWDGIHFHTVARNELIKKFKRAIENAGDDE